MSDPVLFEVRDRIALITVNDPDRRNIMTAETSAGMRAAMARAEADTNVYAVIVTGAGSAFCAGADLSDLGSAPAPEGLHQIYDGFLAVANCILPTVAAVNGPAVGAGMNLALACDVRLAGTSARFDTRFVKIGLHPGGGHTWMLERAVGPQSAAAMVLFGAVVDGRRAVEIGLAWSCHPDDDLV